MALFSKFKKPKSKVSKPLVEKIKKEETAKPVAIEKQPISKPTPIHKKSKAAGSAPVVLIRPIITEKASELEKSNKYLFEVSSNKIEIKKAIKELYGVQPIKVNIQKVPGKMVRYGRSQGRTKNWKKAIITLKPGEKIELTRTK